MFTFTLIKNWLCDFKYFSILNFLWCSFQHNHISAVDIILLLHLEVTKAWHGIKISYIIMYSGEPSDLKPSGAFKLMFTFTLIKNWLCDFKYFSILNFLWCSFQHNHISAVDIILLLHLEVTKAWHGIKISYIIMYIGEPRFMTAQLIRPCYYDHFFGLNKSILQSLLYNNPVDINNVFIRPDCLGQMVLY